MDRQKNRQKQDGISFSPEYWETIDPFMAHKTNAVEEKLAKRRKEIAGIKQTGPILLGLLGCGAVIFSLILGLVIVAAALLWGFSRASKRRKIEAEILKLQAEHSVKFRKDTFIE